MENVQNQKTSQPLNKNVAAVCVTIILISIMISGAILFGKFSSQKSSDNVAINQRSQQENTASLDAVAAVSPSDHVRGDANASVKIIEYSDTECPFCKRFHDTMKQVMDEYGKDGRVAWVYRHFPLDSIHPKADKEAEALECANELGGNDKFWAYTDRLFEITPSNNNLDSSELPKIAGYVGLNVSQFNACISSGKYAAHVEQDYQNALATGGGGTPWSIVVAKNGKKYPLSGAQPYESVKQLIEIALQEK